MSFLAYNLEQREYTDRYSNTSSVTTNKQILLFKFIQLMMYVVYNMDHIHH